MTKENEEVIEKTITQDLSVEKETLHGYIKVVLWVTVVLFVVALISLFRSIALENSVNKIEDQTEKLNTNTEILNNKTEEAKQAAIEARISLEDAINENRKQAPAFIKTFTELAASIERIEQNLCGGPCDEVPKEGE